MDVGYVYIIGNVGNRLYKIGISNDVSKRLRALQTGSPYALTVIEACQCEDPRSVERKLHGICSSFRLQGEWFQMNQNFLSIAVRSIRQRRIGRTFSGV